MLKSLIHASLVLLALSPFNGFGEPKQAASKPLRVGMVYSLTGPAASWAAYGREAAELAAKEINGSPDRGTPEVELLFEDSKTSPSGAVTAYQKLVKVDHVDALIGDVWDFVTNPLVPLTLRDRVVLISPTVVPDAIESQSPFFYTLGSQIGLTKEAVRKFFELNPSVKSAALVVWDNPWGRAFARVWREAAGERGVSIVDERKVYGFDYDYRTDAALIAKKRPDAVIMGYQEERILTRLTEQSFHPVILSTSNLAAVKLQGLLSSEELDGAFYTDWIPDAGFREKFEKEYGHSPMFEARNHYEAVRAIVRAASVNPADLNSGLQSLKCEEPCRDIDFTKGFAVNFNKAKLLKFVDGEAKQIG